MQQHSQDDPLFAGLPVPPERATLRRIGKAIHAGEGD
jgi:hypothetical protein